MLVSGSCHRNYHSLGFNNRNLFSHRSGHQTSGTKATPSAEAQGAGGVGERLCSYFSCSYWLAAFFNWWHIMSLFLQGHLHPLHFQSSVLSLRTQFYKDSSLNDPGQTLPSAILPLPDKVMITSSGDEKKTCLFQGYLSLFCHQEYDRKICKSCLICCNQIQRSDHVHRLVRLVCNKIMFCSGSPKL